LDLFDDIKVYNKVYNQKSYELNLRASSNSGTRVPRFCTCEEILKLK